MSHAVFIVESPAKAKTIGNYLGPNFTVLASYGHVRDLPSKEKAVEPDNDFAMHYRTSPDSEKNVRAILSALKKADTLYLATDPDREGEAISWHIWQEVKERDPKLAARLSVHRVVYTEINKDAIQHAISHPRQLALNLINAQQARRALDYLVGFNLSPVLWRKVKPGLSAGRVQSVALRMICEREDAIEAFKPEEYWSLTGTFFTAQNRNLSANVVTYNGNKVEKFTFTNETDATAAQKELAAHTYTVKSVDKSPKNRYPAPPFITSTLQQEAARKLGFTSRRTMNAAQRLYEAGHITYMRTDSVSLSSEALDKIRAAITKEFGADNLPSKPNFYKSRAKNAQEAHEAVRPTTPSVRFVNAEPDQQKLYNLIWQRTMACQMAPARLEQTTIVLDAAGGKHAFRATGSVVIFPGFLAVYQEGKDDPVEGEDDEKLLPAVTVGETPRTEKVDADQHFTEPPPRFSEASLVKTLEEYGIGRPSTYASIISVLQDRDYVNLDKKRFFPTDVGRTVNRFLTEHFETYVDYNFTANLEEDLDAIARGEHDWKPTLRAFWGPFKERVDDKQANLKKSDLAEKTGETCPECGQGELIWRLSRFGKKFKGCNRYPECTYIESNRPTNADGTPIANGEDTGVPCPSCAQNGISPAGTLVKKTSRRGTTFYSCSTWPKDNYAVWDKPVQEPCPRCSWPVTTLKETKKFGTVKKCPNCNWHDNPEAEEMAKKYAERFTKAKATKDAKKAEAKAAKPKKAPAKKATTAKPKAANKAAAKPKTAAKPKKAGSAKPKPALSKE